MTKSWPQTLLLRSSAFSACLACPVAHHRRQGLANFAVFCFIPTYIDLLC